MHQNLFMLNENNSLLFVSSRYTIFPGLREQICCFYNLRHRLRDLGKPMTQEPKPCFSPLRSSDLPAEREKEAFSLQLLCLCAREKESGCSWQPLSERLRALEPTFNQKGIAQIGCEHCNRYTTLSLSLYICISPAKLFNFVNAAIWFAAATTGINHGRRETERDMKCRGGRARFLISSRSQQNVIIACISRRD